MLNVLCFDKNTIGTALKTWNRNAKVETTELVTRVSPVSKQRHATSSLCVRYYHQSMMTCSLPSRPGSNKLCGVTRKRTLCATGTECVLQTSFSRQSCVGQDSCSVDLPGPQNLTHEHSSSTPRSSLAFRL